MVRLSLPVILTCLIAAVAAAPVPDASPDAVEKRTNSYPWSRWPGDEDPSDPGNGGDDGSSWNYANPDRPVPGKSHVKTHVDKDNSIHLVIDIPRPSWMME